MFSMEKCKVQLFKLSIFIRPPPGSSVLAYYSSPVKKSSAKNLTRTTVNDHVDLQQSSKGK